MPPRSDDLLAPLRELLERLERENAELRAELKRLAHENNEMCDRLFEAKNARERAA